jgi:trehalose-6-phosphate synthase
MESIAITSVSALLFWEAVRNLTKAILQDVEDKDKNSMLVVSEFVGCSPSLSGAIRVNPWSIDNVADAIYSAIKLDPKQRHDRHAKHWRYVSQHTVGFWAQVKGFGSLSRVSISVVLMCMAGPLVLWR